jgi:dTDP-4-dehydrorhamnose 3,5-epimerase-like enzyme
MIVNLKRVGKLTQAAEELPFKVKRAYWIDTKGETRGGHAHKVTRQLFTCVQGHYTFVVDDGVEVKRYLLSSDRPDGVYISWQWHTMEACSSDCIILVFASEFCNEDDYIRDYETWKGYINGNSFNAAAVPGADAPETFTTD